VLPNLARIDPSPSVACPPPLPALSVIHARRLRLSQVPSRTRLRSTVILKAQKASISEWQARASQVEPSRRENRCPIGAQLD